MINYIRLKFDTSKNAYRNTNSEIDYAEIITTKSVGVNPKDLLFVKVPHGTFPNVCRVEKGKEDILILNNKENTRPKKVNIGGQLYDTTKICVIKTEETMYPMIDGDMEIEFEVQTVSQNKNEEQKDYVATLIEDYNIYSYNGVLYYEKNGGFVQASEHVIKKWVLPAANKYDRTAEADEMVKKLENYLYNIDTDGIRAVGDEDVNFKRIDFTNGYYDLIKKEFVNATINRFRPFSFPHAYKPLDEINPRVKASVDKLLDNISTTNLISDGNGGFIRNMGENNENRVLVESMIALATTPFVSKDLFFLVGTSGDNWKTTLMDLIIRTCGEQWKGNLDLDELTRDPQKACVAFLNKKCAVQDDTNPDTNISNIRTIKEATSLSSGGTMSAKILYKDVITFTNHATMVINCNKLPKGLTADNGIYNRTKIINVSLNQNMKMVALSGEDFDNLKTPEASQYLHHIIINRLNELREKNFVIENTKLSQDTLDAYQSSANNINDWYGELFPMIDTHISADDNKVLLNLKKLFENYNQWFEYNYGEKPLNRINNFEQELIMLLTRDYKANFVVDSGKTTFNNVYEKVLILKNFFITNKPDQVIVLEKTTQKNDGYDPIANLEVKKEEYDPNKITRVNNNKPNPLSGEIF